MRLNDEKSCEAKRLWDGGASVELIARNIGARSGDLRRVFDAAPGTFRPQSDMPAALKISGSNGIPAYFMREGMCRFEHGVAGTSPMFCGEPASGDYCCNHARIVASSAEVA